MPLGTEKYIPRNQRPALLVFPIHNEVNTRPPGIAVQQSRFMHAQATGFNFVYRFFQLNFHAAFDDGHDRARKSRERKIWKCAIIDRAGSHRKRRARA